MTNPPNIDAIIADLSEAQKRNIRTTPLPQPLAGHWFWPGSLSQAIELARLGMLNKEGFTPLGMSVRSALIDKEGGRG
jgi:hypothetical protein